MGRAQEESGRTAGVAPFPAAAPTVPTRATMRAATAWLLLGLLALAGGAAAVEDFTPPAFCSGMDCPRFDQACREGQGRRA